MSINMHRASRSPHSIASMALPSPRLSLGFFTLLQSQALAAVAAAAAAVPTCVSLSKVPASWPWSSSSCRLS